MPSDYWPVIVQPDLSQGYYHSDFDETSDAPNTLQDETDYLNNVFSI